MTLGTVLTSAIVLACPGIPEGITLCTADRVAVLAVSQGLRKEKQENIRGPRRQC
jgi:hypothetical protein